MSLVTYDTHGSLLQPGATIAPLYSTSSPYSSAVRVGFRYNTPSFTKLKIKDNKCYMCVFMFHRAFFSSIIYKHQYMHFFHIPNCISLKC